MNRRIKSLRLKYRRKALQNLDAEVVRQMVSQRNGQDLIDYFLDQGVSSPEYASNISIRCFRNPDRIEEVLQSVRDYYSRSEAPPESHPQIGCRNPGSGEQTSSGR